MCQGQYTKQVLKRCLDAAVEQQLAVVAASTTGRTQLVLDAMFDLTCSVKHVNLCVQGGHCGLHFPVRDARSSAVRHTQERSFAGAPDSDMRTMLPHNVRWLDEKCAGLSNANARHVLTENLSNACMCRTAQQAMT
jgi:hypothetical protein